MTPPFASAIVAADWKPMATAYRTRAALHIVDDMMPTDDARRPSVGAHRTEFREALRDCEPTRRRGLLVDHVTTQVAAAMGLASPQLLDPSAGFLPIRHGFADERDASAVAR
jgi:phthiocerol/phenolphthiocerol synthesis type-I polyketide synthase B